MGILQAFLWMVAAIIANQVVAPNENDRGVLYPIRLAFSWGLSLATIIFFCLMVWATGAWAWPIMIS